MLAVEGRDELWCAACAAVDGSVELRVGEPRRRGLLRRRDADGEAWLREHGFTTIPDARARPEPVLGDHACADTLAAALEHGLGADPAAPLRHVLTQPGIIEGSDPPPADAPLEAHLAAALRGLARAGRGRFHVDSGRPAELRAVVWALDGELIVEREVPGVAGSPGESWREPLTPEGAAAAADELARRIRAERPGADDDPWLLAYIGSPPADAG